jgi:hypothetical protein
MRREQFEYHKGKKQMGELGTDGRIKLKQIIKE